MDQFTQTQLYQKFKKFILDLVICQERSSRQTIQNTFTEMEVNSEVFLGIMKIVRVSNIELINNQDFWNLLWETAHSLRRNKLEPSELIKSTLMVSELKQWSENDKNIGEFKNLNELKEDMVNSIKNFQIGCSTILGENQSLLNEIEKGDISFLKAMKDKNLLINQDLKTSNQSK